MEPVTLRPITRENWNEAVKLKVAPEQEGFVARNTYSIAQSKFDPCTPFAVYAGDTMVGFIMYGTDPDIPPERGSYVIYRLMIDARYQGKGYGRAAMQAALADLRTLPDCREVLVGFVPGNAGAERLYRSLGFEVSDLQWPDETVLRYCWN